MEISVGVWAAVVLGGLPLLGLLFWWWNELRYVLPLKLQRSATGAKLLTGLLGFPFIGGELLPFLWYFKFLCRPNEFINAKRAQYGDGVGMYRTHLFGSPSIITCFPAVNKFVLQSSDIFTLVWPSNMIFLVMFSVHGKSHERLKSYITKVINQPDALRGIALLVQPHMIASLESWAQKGRINAYDEVKKFTAGFTLFQDLWFYASTFGAVCENRHEKLCRPLLFNLPTKHRPKISRQKPTFRVMASVNSNGPDGFSWQSLTRSIRRGSEWFWSDFCEPVKKETGVVVEQRSPPSGVISAITDKISSLTLHEVSDLTEVLRKKLGVKEMSAMVIIMPGMGFGGLRGA
ncbi:hypothetical protein ACFX2B_030262 [Malus domestica]